MANVDHYTFDRYIRGAFLGGQSGIEWRVFTFETDGDGFTEGDVLRCIKLPENAVITNLILAADALDDADELAFDVGTEANADLFMDGSTIGQTGGVDDTEASSGTLPYLCPAGTAPTAAELDTPWPGDTGTTLQITIATDAETPTADGGKVSLIVGYLNPVL